MKRWLRFSLDGATGFGTLSDDGETISVHQGQMFGACSATGQTVPLAEVELLCPAEPAKFIGLWNNYHELATKLGQALPAEPLYFSKTSNSYLAPGGVIRKPPRFEGKIFYEGELGIVIGRTCSNVSEGEAAGHIFGYTCVNDVTAFDLLSRDPSFAQWTRAKSCDTFGPFGPVIATDLDWSQLRIRTLINGRERQNYPASDMILPPARIVSLISGEMTLLPGDVIACGTSVGALPMKAGTVVEVAIDGIGVLKNIMQSSGDKE